MEDPSSPEDASGGGLLGQAWTYLDAFPPTHYLLVLATWYLEVLMDRGVLVLLSFLTGVLAVLALEAFVLWRLYNRATPTAPPQVPVSEVRLPEVGELEPVCLFGWLVS